MKKILIYLIFILIPLYASAQFYVTGDDPGRLKWYSIDTEHYRLIYPEGTDSLARVYGMNLERYRIPVSRSSGYLPSGPGQSKMPVVLHAWNSSNGSVAWAPRRMDLFPIPSAYSPEPLPWADMLAVHESRHVSQMQFGMTKALRPGNWIFGEMFNILVSLVYPGISTMEGDAVITETAYSKSGRGRTAGFLNYYRVALDNGINRSWGQWRFESQRNYTPTYYALGYLTTGGIRTFYDYPEYMSDSYHLIARKPYRFGTFHRLAKEKAGKKWFNEVFMEVAGKMNLIWKEEADLRRPYIPMEAVTEEPRLYTDYTCCFFIGDQLHSLREGLENTMEIVRITDGKPVKITSFSAQAGEIRTHEGKLYWSESNPDERWTVQTHSRIRYISCDKDRITKNDLTDGQRLLYNPSPSHDGRYIACVEYRTDGSTSVVVLDAADGKEIHTIKGSDGVQPVETAWIDDRIYVSGISDNGYGIYRICGKSWENVLEPQPVMIRELSSHGNELTFTCDRTGSDEFYHYDPEKGILTRKTSIRYGGEGFAYSPDGKWLYFSSQTVKGKHLFRTPADSLFSIRAEYSDRHRYFLAEELTRQEQKIAATEKTECAETDMIVSDNCFSEPERYRKLPHAINVHSWAPVYVNVDNIMNLSYDYVYQAASLGATGIIQNRLSTATGEFGYSAHKDPYNPAKWRHSGHLRFTYTGLYPVFEVKLDYNDRSSRQYNATATLTDGGTFMSITSKETGTPFIQGRIRTYIPFSFSKGGWHSGIVPQLSYSITNDFFNTSMAIVSQKNSDGAMALGGKAPVFMGALKGRNGIMHSISGSVRGYTMLPTASSSVYPRWGIGAEAGIFAQLVIGKFYSPAGYAYIYGYIPGFMRTHGIRLSAMYQRKLKENCPFGMMAVDVLPRGFSGTPMLGTSLSSMNAGIMKITAEYGMPVYIGDISVLGSLLYLKRLTLTPHFDYSFIGKNGEGLWSAGCNLTFNLESVLWLEWPCSIGVAASYNGGPSFRTYQNDFQMKSWFVGPTFNVTF